MFNDHATSEDLVDILVGILYNLESMGHQAGIEGTVNIALISNKP